jgi:superoxide reductase
MDRRTLIKFGLFTGATGVLAPQWALGETKVKFESPMAGGVFLTADAPGRWGKKVASHVPNIATQQGEEGKLTVNVTTRHENDGFKHYIIKHMLLDADFRYLDEHMFDPAVAGIPESSFTLDAYTGVLYALSVCNKHDTWLSAVKI